MKNTKLDYIKAKELLHHTMNNLLLEKNKENENISQDTRFEIKNKATADLIMSKVDLHGKEDYYKLRKKWSYYIFASLAGTILFQYFLAWFLIFWVTHQLFPFSSVYNLFFLIAWENFAQILGLSYIIVRFLFSPEK